MYKKVAKILDDAFGDSWFLDSGSLLGVVREGKFLKSDQGIDISVIVDNYQMPIIKKVEEEMKQLGFISSKFDWGGVIYKYCFVPSKKLQFEYSIDFHLFKKRDDAYLCPQLSLRGLNLFESIIARCQKGDAMYGDSYSNIKKAILSTFEYFYRYKFHYFNHPIKMRQFAEKGKGDLYFWVIPCNVDLTKDVSNIYGLNSLKFSDDYLKYRYRDWHTPVSDWVTTRDDGGIKKTNITEIDEFLLV